MKSLPGKMGVILIGLVIFGYTEARGGDWKQWTRCGDYYGVESIARISKNIVRVWTKHVFPEEAIRERIDRFIKRIWPRVKPLNNAERKAWILNEMSLVHWVESQGGRIINEEFERVQKKRTYLPLSTLLRRQSSFTIDDQDREERR